MMLAPSENLQARIVQVRRSLRETSLDVLIVQHPANVRYLTNFDGSSAVLVLGQNESIFITDGRYDTAARDLLSSSFIDENPALKLVTRSYDEAITEALLDVSAVRIGFESAHCSHQRFQSLTVALNEATGSNIKNGGNDNRPLLIPTNRLVERIRMIKDAFEISVIRTAATLLSEVAKNVLCDVVMGRSERETAHHIDKKIHDIGFECPAFDTIVASGPNSAFPHARPGDRRIGTDDLVLLDFGGVYEGYCVDLSRTVSIGNPSAELRRLHCAVVEAQGAAIAKVSPGCLASDVDTAARDVLTHYGLGGAFLHGTGHGLGLEVHEEPRVGRKGPDQAAALASGLDGRLEVGMVLTVEPGAYLPGLGGARIEDDVLVTPTGCELLTDVDRMLCKAVVD
jgi:Xaa-Pro aminopeptidase